MPSRTFRLDILLQADEIDRDKQDTQKIMKYKSGLFRVGGPISTDAVVKAKNGKSRFT